MKKRLFILFTIITTVLLVPSVISKAAVQVQVVPTYHELENAATIDNVSWLKYYIDYGSNIKENRVYFIMNNLPSGKDIYIKIDERDKINILNTSTNSLVFNYQATALIISDNGITAILDRTETLESVFISNIAVNNNNFILVGASRDFIGDFDSSYYYNNGYQQGNLDGYNSGYDIGFDDGFNLAVSDGETFGFASLLAFVLIPFELLGVELFAGIKIGHIALIPIIFGLLSFLLSLRGGKK